MRQIQLKPVVTFWINFHQMKLTNRQESTEDSIKIIPWKHSLWVINWGNHLSDLLSAKINTNQIPESGSFKAALAQNTKCPEGCKFPTPFNAVTPNWPGWDLIYLDPTRLLPQLQTLLQPHPFNSLNPFNLTPYQAITYHSYPISLTPGTIQFYFWSIS